MTCAAFNEAASVKAIDISDVAIERARARSLPNAEFHCADFMATPFLNFDVVCAIECLYYLTSDELVSFFEKLCCEHPGKIFVFSNPIIGGPYFLHVELLRLFSKFNLRLLRFHNVNVYWKPAYYRVVANLVKLPLIERMIDLLPDQLIYQRLYILQVSN